MSLIFKPNPAGPAPVQVTLSLPHDDKFAENVAALYDIVAGLWQTKATSKPTPDVSIDAKPIPRTMIDGDVNLAKQMKPLVAFGIPHRHRVGSLRVLSASETIVAQPGT